MMKAKTLHFNTALIHTRAEPLFAPGAKSGQKKDKAEREEKILKAKKMLDPALEHRKESQTLFFKKHR
ncbi:MAG: hypothetical protein WKG06_28635 [Segetibacter sp.]